MIGGETTLEDALRALQDAAPMMGVKKLTAHLQSDHPSWDVNCKVVKEALEAIEAAKTSTPAPTPMSSCKDPCWGCGKEPAAGDSFQVCSKCAELHLASKARFCSRACLAENWPRHKKWHKLQALQQKELAAAVAIYPHQEQAAKDIENLLDTADPDTAAESIAQKMGEHLHLGTLEAEMARLKPGDRYGQKLLQNLKDSIAAESVKRAQRGDPKLGRLVVEAQHLHARGAYDKAAKKLLKGVDEFKDHPDLPELYATLATIYRDSGDVPRSAMTHLKVAELTQGYLTSIGRHRKAARSDVEMRERGNQITWARAVTRAWSALCTPMCEHMPKPDYLEDGFRATAALVLRVQSSRAKDEMDYETDLWDAVCMRVTALVTAPMTQEDRIEHRQLLERGRRLARTPDQLGVLAALEAGVEAVSGDGLHGLESLPGMPDSMLKKLQLMRDSVPAAPSDAEG